MPAFEAIQYQREMGGGNVLISVLTNDATERDRVKAISDNAGSVTAAEVVVDHAYSRPSGAVGAAMSPAAIHTRAMRSSPRGTDASIIEPSALRSYRMASSQRDQEREEGAPRPTMHHNCSKGMTK